MPAAARLIDFDDQPFWGREEPYEAEYFAAKHGLSLEEARDILARNSFSRERADAAAERHRLHLA